MSKKTARKVYKQYPWPEDAPKALGNFRIIADFLPLPGELVKREAQEKVTLSLSKTSLAFFRKHAKANRVPYQKMIRNLLDEYVRRANEHST